MLAFRLPRPGQGLALGRRIAAASLLLRDNRRLSRADFVVAQVHGPLFQQFAQVAAAALVAQRFDRRLAVDTSMYRHYSHSPDVLSFLAPQACEVVDLSSFVLKRLEQPSPLKRADRRRALKSLFAPTMMGQHEVPSPLPRGSVVLHGLASFETIAGQQERLTRLFTRVKPDLSAVKARVFVSDEPPWVRKATIEKDDTVVHVTLVAKEFAESFRALLNRSELVTNDAEVAFWLRLMTAEGTRIVCSA